MAADFINLLASDGPTAIANLIAIASAAYAMGRLSLHAIRRNGAKFSILLNRREIRHLQLQLAFGRAVRDDPRAIARVTVNAFRLLPISVFALLAMTLNVVFDVRAEYPAAAPLWSTIATYGAALLAAFFVVAQVWQGFAHIHRGLRWYGWPTDLRRQFLERLKTLRREQ